MTALLSLSSVLCVASGGTAEPRGDESRDPECCNVVELRQYTLHPGHRDGFVELFDSTFADALDETGMTVIGQFRDLDRPNRFVWIRGFQNMDARAKELGAFYDGDLWHRHRDEANRSIDDSDNVLLLQPASAALRFQGVPARPAAGAGYATPDGLIIVTLFYASSVSLAEFGKLFESTLRAHYEAAGAQTLAGFVTSAEPNNFPRLPIRTGEHVYVWVARFAGPEAYTRYQVRLHSDKTWNRAWKMAGPKLVREPEVLRLTPTVRSRLRG
jgi:hypothetical protein